MPEFEDILEKIKPGRKAKNYACTSLHIVASALFISAFILTAAQVASRFSEKAGEMVSKLGSEKLFYFTVGVGASTAIAGIAYFMLYLTTRKANMKLEEDNQTLKAGISFVADPGKNDDQTDKTLQQVRADTLFIAAQGVAQA